jgi:AraC family transcriptional regulator
MASGEEYRSRIQRSLDYARAHLEENPSLAELADAAAFSPYHFHRIFAAFVGETPAEHIRRLRIEKAASELLMRPAAPITEIALSCGFATPSAFSRDFRARFGLSPRSYRERRGGLPTSRAASFLRSHRGASRGTGLAEDAHSDYRYETFPAMRLACCSHVGPYGPGIGRAWGTLMRWAGPRGLLGPGTRSYGVSWDNPEVTEGHKLRYDACLEVPPETEGSRAVFIRDLSPYRCIVLPYRGPERGLSGAYARLYYRLLPESSCEPEDFPAFEHYLAPPRGLFVRRFDLEIYLPVKPLT